MKTNLNLPVAVIGAGPVGLAAAAHLLERGETPLVLEAGRAAGSSVRAWAHVRMFSPWRYALDAASRRLLAQTDWRQPDPEELPTGGDIVTRYLEPLARLTPLRAHIRYGERVTAVTRQGTDKVKSKSRAERPFSIRTQAPDGSEREHLAKAVIDASGTWTTPNPIGADGLPVPGEAQLADRIDYGIPDVRGERRAEFAGRAVLVVGSGHSAFNAVLDLLALREAAPTTRIVWALRRESLGNVFGGGAADALPARGDLGQRVKAALDHGALELVAPFQVRRLDRSADGGLRVSGDAAGRARSLSVDRVVVATGFRPELGMLREMRIEIDPALECARTLGPLIDPNVHSCGTVRPHGARELAHPEPGLYIIGMKSYGRAPTFLLATGYEQARSVAAAIAGDHEAAARVELDLPETGVCSVPPEIAAAATGCCGGAPKDDASACCVLDEEKKAAGESGCGCSSAPATTPKRAGVAACCG